MTRQVQTRAQTQRVKVTHILALSVDNLVIGQPNVQTVKEAHEVLDRIVVLKNNPITIQEVVEQDKMTVRSVIIVNKVVIGLEIVHNHVKKINLLMETAIKGSELIFEIILKYKFDKD